MGIIRALVERVAFRSIGAMGQYNVVPPTLVDGEACILELDINGNLLIAPGAPALWGLFHEDTPAVDGDLGQAALAVRNDGANTVLTSANGDYSWISVDDRGQVFVRTDPSPAEPWQTLRTFLGTVADSTGPNTIQVVTGVVDVSLLAYPGAGLPGLTVDVNGQTCTFGVGAPVSMANLLVLLNAAMPDMTWTAPGAAFVLIGTKNSPGNIVLSGTALAILGLVAGTTGPWVTLPQSRGVIEVGFLPGFSVLNAPDAVNFRVWRLSATSGGTAEIAGKMRIAASNISYQQSRRFAFDGSDVFLQVTFTGGTAPTITGTAEVRVVYDGSEYVEVPTWHEVGPSALALDQWDNSPTRTEYNYSTAKGDGSAVRTTNNTITLTPTAPVIAPTTEQLCAVKIITTTSAEPLMWEQGRNAVLTAAGAVITVNSLDGTVITVPAAATSIEVMWAGPDRATYTEDSASVDAERGVLILGVRQDTLASSVTTDGDHAWLKVDSLGALWTRSRAFDEPTGADKNEPIYSDADRFVPFTFGAAGIDSSGGAVTTYYYVDCAGYGYLGFQWTALVGAEGKTLTLESSLRDDGTAPAAFAAGDWQDTTFQDTGAATWIAAQLLEIDVPVTRKWMRIKIVTAIGGAGNGWTGYGRKRAS